MFLYCQKYAWITASVRRWISNIFMLYSWNSGMIIILSWHWNNILAWALTISVLVPRHHVIKFFIIYLSITVNISLINHSLRINIVCTNKLGQYNIHCKLFLHHFLYIQFQHKWLTSILNVEGRSKVRRYKTLVSLASQNYFVKNELRGLIFS